MYKCSHCNITIPDDQTEGRVVKVGPKDNPKFYCMKCGEPVEYIPDMPQATGVIHGAQATLISNSDNRITTNNYYGGGSPDEQIDTPYGPCRKSETRLCKKCRQWVSLSYYNTEHNLCDECLSKAIKSGIDEGKSYFDLGFYGEAISCFQKCEDICINEIDLLNLKTLIGKCYYELKDYCQALKYFIAASRKNAESMYYIAISYFNGTGITKDECKGLELFQKSADMGCQKATEFLAERKRYEEWKKGLEFMELHPIVENGKYGFSDESGNIVIPCKWKFASAFSGKYARIKDNNDKWGILGKTGEIVIPCNWRDVGTFYDDLAPVRDDTGKWGFINKKGETVVICKWKDVSWDFIEGLARVQDEYSRWGYINKIGKMFVPCKWKSANPFSEGRARVEDFNGKWFYIDMTGKIISARQFDRF